MKTNLSQSKFTTKASFSGTLIQQEKKANSAPQIYYLGSDCYSKPACF